MEWTDRRDQGMRRRRHDACRGRSRPSGASTRRSSRPRTTSSACGSAAWGGRSLRIDAEMALHDIAMYRFRQWWRRSTRTGHAYAEGSAMYGRTPERHFVRQTRSAVFWGIMVPIIALGLAWPTRGISLALLGRLSRPLPAHLPLLRPASRLAAGRCPPERSLDCPCQVPPGGRRGPVLAWATGWASGVPSSSIRDLARAEGSVLR